MPSCCNTDSMPYFPTQSRTGPDQTKSASMSETHANPTDFVGDPGCGFRSETKSGRAGLVEFGHSYHLPEGLAGL